MSRDMQIAEAVRTAIHEYNGVDVNIDLSEIIAGIPARGPVDQSARIAELEARMADLRDTTIQECVAVCEAQVTEYGGQDWYATCANACASALEDLRGAK